MVTRSSRGGGDAFVTVSSGVAVSTTAHVHSVEEVLRRHREEMGKSNTANISVKEALRTRGVEAMKVITSELKQMIDKRVWAQ
jgi:hypothetical protein